MNFRRSLYNAPAKKSLQEKDDPWRVFHEEDSKGYDHDQDKMCQDLRATETDSHTCWKGPKGIPGKSIGKNTENNLKTPRNSLKIPEIHDIQYLCFPYALCGYALCTFPNSQRAPIITKNFLGVFQRPLTLILLQKHRDTNWSSIVIQMGGVQITSNQEEGILLQNYLAIEWEVYHDIFRKKYQGQGSMWLCDNLWTPKPGSAPAQFPPSQAALDGPCLTIGNECPLLEINSKRAKSVLVISSPYFSEV